MLQDDDLQGKCVLKGPDAPSCQRCDPQSTLDRLLLVKHLLERLFAVAHCRDMGCVTGSARIGCSCAPKSVEPHAELKIPQNTYISIYISISKFREHNAVGMEAQGTADGDKGV
jgi:hypothetical protein